MTKVLFYDLPPYHRVEIEGKVVRIFSDHKKSKGKELAQWFTKDGYLRTKIKSKNTTIHSIVALLTLGERPEDLVINHKDGDKLNNSPDNLEYCTIADNIRHSVKHGMHVSNHPERHGNYKDGRCADLNAYKLAWYHKNKERLKREAKGCYKYRRNKNG